MPETPEVADFEVPVSTIPEYVRVKAKDTKHVSSVVASAADPEVYTVLKNEPATYPDGTPLPPEFPELSDTSGQKAEPKKEISR